jgi:hypothetical protein
MRSENVSGPSAEPQGPSVGSEPSAHASQPKRGSNSRRWLAQTAAGVDSRESEEPPRRTLRAPNSRVTRNWLTVSTAHVLRYESQGPSALRTRRDVHGFPSDGLVLGEVTEEATTIVADHREPARSEGSRAGGDMHRLRKEARLVQVIKLAHPSSPRHSVDVSPDVSARGTRSRCSP